MRRVAVLTGLAFLLLFAVSCKPGAYSHTQPIAAPPAETPSPAPTPAPTPEPETVLLFTQDAAYPMPGGMEQLSLGGQRVLSGTVDGNYPLTRISISVTCQRSDDPFYPYEQTVTFPAAWDRRSYSFDSADTGEGVSLSSMFSFAQLKTGIHTLTLSAQSIHDRRPEQLFSVQFYILSDDWTPIRKSDFGVNGIDAAESFFGGKRERFLYSYQWVWNRYIVAEPAWEAAYITEFTGIGEKPWRIHVDALDYYALAGYFIQNVRFRVHGTNGDTGILPLTELVTEYNGSYVSRFTSSKKTISHHAFGTATDLNASMPPNRNNSENNALIDTEVGSLTVYNGILDDEIGPYYDFTYSGSYACTAFCVPETLVNYLLFELAFYRAGFQWGHYYVSTSDAMHFVLTEDIRIRHDDSRGLRKVYDYAE